METKSIWDFPKDVARYLGATVRCVENDINRLFPFFKGAGRSIKQVPVFRKPVIAPSAARPVSPVPPIRREVPQPRPVVREQEQDRVAPTTASAPAPAPIIERKPVSVEVGLRDIRFENKVEELKADIIFKDIQSPIYKVRLKAMDHLKDLSKPTAIKIVKSLLSGEQDNVKIVEMLNALVGIGTKRLFPNNCSKIMPSTRMPASGCPHCAPSRNTMTMKASRSCLPT